MLGTMGMIDDVLVVVGITVLMMLEVDVEGMSVEMLEEVTGMMEVSGVEEVTTTAEDVVATAIRINMLFPIVPKRSGLTRTNNCGTCLRCHNRQCRG